MRKLDVGFLPTFPMKKQQARLDQVLGDLETPVAAFAKLVGDEPGFLLESVEGGERWARWSFVGGRPQFTLEARNGVTEVRGAGPALPAGDPLTVLERVIGRLTVPSAE